MSRNDEDEDPSGFEDELALMDAIEAEKDSEAMDVDGDGPEYEATSSKWARPALPPIDSSKDVIAFQQIDIDYYIGMVSSKYIFIVNISPALSPMDSSKDITFQQMDIDYYIRIVLLSCILIIT